MKRYGWYRVYNDFPSHPKWRLVAVKAGVSLVEVLAVAQALFALASKNRRGGWIGNFEPFECAVMLDMPPEKVVSIYQTFEQIDWVGDGFIVDWADRNPDQEDPTAAERQRNARARKVARRKFASGQPLTEAEAMMLSRVTSYDEPPQRHHAPLGVFCPVDPRTDEIAEVNAALAATARNARAYLFGSGTNGPTDMGPASAVVAEKLGMRRFAADTTLRRWLGEVDGDLIALATIIDGANHGGVQGESFEAIVKQGIGRVAREKHAGPPLPLGVATIQGGRRG